MSFKYSLVLTLWVCFVKLSSCDGDVIKCIECDSTKDPNCLGLGSCKFEPPKDGKVAPGCFTYKVNGVVKRGYQRDEPECKVESDVCKLCSNGEDKNKPCNTGCITPPKCLKCDSSTDKECLAGTSENTCNSTNLACQQCFDKETGILTRKCGSSSSSTCGVCYGDNCNNGLTCFKCKEGENCAASDGQAKVCDKESKGCAIKLTSTDETQRDCVGKDESCDLDKKCNLTAGHLSNTGTFPDDHLSCYQCNGEPACAASQSDSKVVVCKKYKKDDQCYIKEVDGKIQRGCLSDGDGVECTTEKKCRKCPKSGCNVEKDQYQPTLKCITCKDEKCALGRPSSKAERCSGMIPFYEDEFCYTKVTDKNVQRGCGRYDGETCQNKDCDRCDTDGCNNKNYFKQTCARCRDDDGTDRANCTADGKAFLAQACTKEASITEETKGCYVMKHDGVIYRGCIADLPIDEMHMCLKNDTNQCGVCPDIDCNTFKLPNASRPSTEIGLATFLLLIAGLLNGNIF